MAFYLPLRLLCAVPSHDVDIFIARFAFVLFIRWDREVALLPLYLLPHHAFVISASSSGFEIASVIWLLRRLIKQFTSHIQWVLLREKEIAVSVEVSLWLDASSLIKSDSPIVLLLFQLLQCEIDLGWLEIIAGGRRFETNSACVHLDFRCYELGKPAHLTNTLLLVEVFKGRLVHVFLSDVQEEVNLV